MLIRILSAFFSCCFRSYGKTPGLAAGCTFLLSLQPLINRAWRSTVSGWIA